MKISSYCYAIRAVEYGFPLEASISSFAQVSDSVYVAVDESFQDGTIEKISSLADRYGNIFIEKINYPIHHPNCDGLIKNYIRGKAEESDPEILMSFDIDEVFNPNSKERLNEICLEMVNKNIPIVGMGTINWFNGNHIKYSEPSYKERLTLSKKGIKRGIALKNRIYSDDRREVLLRIAGNPLEYIPYYWATPCTNGAEYLVGDLEMPIKAKTIYSYAQPIPLENTKKYLYKLAESFLNKRHIWIHHYGWYDIPRKWEMKNSSHYLHGHLYGEYLNGVSDYTLNKDDDEPVDFFASPTVYPIERYIDGIYDEMLNSTVLRLDWLPHPENSYLNEWTSSPDRRTYGLKKKKLNKPSYLKNKILELLSLKKDKRFIY